MHLTIPLGLTIQGNAVVFLYAVSGRRSELGISRLRFYYRSSLLLRPVDRGRFRFASAASCMRHDPTHLFSVTAHHGDQRQAARFPQPHDAFPCARQVHPGAPGQLAAHFPMAGCLLQQVSHLPLSGA